MDYIDCSNGIKIPQLIYGTAWKKSRTSDLVTKAIDLGFRAIDTACQPKHYSESGVGEALKKVNLPREQMFLQTKFTPISGQDPARIPYDHSAPLETQVAQSFSVSQKNLGTQYVDSLVLHSPLAEFQDTLIVWRAMEKIYEQGGSKVLGISNCYDLDVLRQLYESSKIKPMVIQNRFYRETNFDKDLRKWCLSKNIIYQSFWTLTANPEVVQSNTVKSIAEKYRKTKAQAFFRFITQKGIAPLTGTCSEEHMKQDLDIFSFELSQQDVQAIEDLLN